MVGCSSPSSKLEAILYGFLDLDLDLSGEAEGEEEVVEGEEVEEGVEEDSEGAGDTDIVDREELLE